MAENNIEKNSNIEEINEDTVSESKVAENSEKQEKPKTTRKPEIVHTDRIPYVKYTLNKLSNKELALLVAMAAVEDTHPRMPKKLGEMVRKTPMYKRAHIAAVLQQAFHKAKE